MIPFILSVSIVLIHFTPQVDEICNFTTSFEVTPLVIG